MRPILVLLPLLGATAALGQLPEVRPCSVNMCSTVTGPSACVEVDYGPTAWRTCISNQRRGLTLGPADLRRDGKWVRILAEANVAEVFVPYHDSLRRIYDMQSCNADCTREVMQEDAGPGGALITLSGQTRPRVIRELRDRGMAWLCKGPNPATAKRYRGQELLLWGVYDVQNYDYIIEYGLRDDGAITFRLGATGWNNDVQEPLSTFEAHMHNVLWRVDVDLNGSASDTVVAVAHHEGAPFSEDEDTPFNGGVEGTMTWDPEQFTSIVVEDAALNAHGNHLGYELRPVREGNARHLGKQIPGLQQQEIFTESDFAVTRYHAFERNAYFSNIWMSPDEYLLSIRPRTPFNSFTFGTANGESIANTDIVLWYRTSTHHEPHDEDHAPTDRDETMRGITLMHWTGFNLEPHDFFDYNPLGGPHRDACR